MGVQEGVRAYCQGFEWHSRSRQQKALDLKTLRTSLSHLSPKDIVASYNQL